MHSVAVFNDALRAIKTSFPWLAVNELSDHPQLEAFAELPIQPGLSLPIQINLQNNDELHLVVSNLWVEWFPCTNAIKRDAFIRAVIGLVIGELEIEETYILGRPAMATLRARLNTNGHSYLARWSNLLTLLPLPRSRRIVRNESAA